LYFSVCKLYVILPYPCKEKSMLKKMKIQLRLYLTVLLLILIFSLSKLISEPESIKVDNQNIFCRSGMTTKPDRRRQEWEQEYKELGKVIISWNIISTFNIKNCRTTI